jgi:lysophospholipase L1-like esterase
VADDVSAGRPSPSWGWREVALALGSFAVVWIAIELGARAVGFASKGYLGRLPGNCIRGSDLLGYELVPHCTGVLFDTPLTTNGLGLRGPEPSDEPVTRVLAIGDSCTFGYHVREEESYPAVLGRLLAARGDGRRYEVLNAGVPGYTSHHGLEYLIARGLALAPAVVIAGFQFNDAFPGGDIAEELESRRRHRTFVRIDEFLLAHVRLYRWLRMSPLSEAAKPPRVSVERYRENLKEIVARARAAGARVILIDWQLGPLRLYRETVASVAAELDVPLVRYAGPRLDGWVHPTAEGYARLAAELAQVVGDAVPPARVGAANVRVRTS